jgi:hypothetical protein
VIFTYPNETQYIYPVPSAGGGADFEVERRTITAAEASAKQLTLSSVPANITDVILLVQGAGNMALGIDFSVSGSVLSWSGLGLDGLLAASDEITILYKT